MQGKNNITIGELRDVIHDVKNELISWMTKCTNKTQLSIDESTITIIKTIFIECNNIRKDIGYQTILIKLIEDNLDNIEFEDKSGMSSKIEVSVGANLFGTGIKWVLDIDFTKVNYKELKESISNFPFISIQNREKLLRLINAKIKK